MTTFYTSQTGTVIFLLVLGVLANKNVGGQTTFTGERTPRGNLFKHAGIATEHPRCTQIGVHVMKDLNGTAIDAAIASLICIGVVNNHSSGIGGDPSGAYEVIDFREMAPGAASQDMFVGEPERSKIGGLAVAVPGELSGLFYAYRKYKKLRANGPKWKDLLGPSIDLARNGFQVSKKLYEAIKATQAIIKEHKELADLYLRDGMPIPSGETISRPQLADTLEIIANDADAELDIDAPQYGTPKSFYEGPVAEGIVKAVSENGGILTLEDMKKYTAVSRKPLHGSYRKYNLVTVGPPGSGSVLIYMLNILKNFSFHSMFNAKEAHRIIEAMKFGYGARMSLGDWDVVPEVETIVAEMTQNEHGKKAADKIDDTTTFHDPKHYTGQLQSMNKHGTTHVSAMDRYGTLATVTSTINLIFGSMVLDPKTGIILNDHMDDFSTPGSENFFGIPPSKNNYVAPRKRPISSAAPVCIEREGQPYIVSGAAGGSLITSAVMFSLINIIDFALSPEAALAAPRMHHQLIPDEVIIENTFSMTLESELKKLGHKFRRFKGAQYRSSVQLIARDNEGFLHAVSDPRKEGFASGF